MKKQLFTLIALICGNLLFAQTPTNKILLKNGQKIRVTTTMTINSSLAAGMDANTSSSTENQMEVKQTTEKDYTISNTLTKMKYSADMVGQSSSYDSEKKEDQNTEMGQSMSEKLNKPTDIKLDSKTGEAISTQPAPKKEVASDNAMMNLLSKMGENAGDEAVVGGAFELIPAGKKPGDTWTDSTVDKESKTIRKFTFKSLADTGAVVTINATMETTGTMEMMGMSVDVSTTTETTSEILFDPATALVRRKSSEANLSGSFQVMGQSAPITAKVTTVSVYE